MAESFFALFDERGELVANPAHLLKGCSCEVWMRGVQICYLGVDTLIPQVIPQVYMPLFPGMARYKLEFRRNVCVGVGRRLMGHAAS
jgi:hypothetical protein